MWIAEYDTQGMEFPTCVHVTKTTGNMTHGATYVPIEDGKAAREENKRLRELARESYAVIESLCELVENSPGCSMCPTNQDEDKACGSAEVYCRMRELGVESKE